MTWLYAPSICAPDMADFLSVSDSLCQTLARSVTWREKHTPPRSWSHRCKRLDWMRHLFGPTLSPLTLQRGVDAWTSSLRVSRANHTALPGRALGLAIPENSRTPLCGSSVSANPDTCSSRTSRSTASLASQPCFEDLPASGSMRSGACSARPKSGRTTCANGSSSSLPTPTVSDATTWRLQGDTQTSRNLAARARRGLLPTPTVGDSRASGSAGYSTASGRHSGTTLTDAVVRYPTPTMRDHRSGSTSGINRQGGQLLPEAVGGLLSPQFVEWMMGLPIGWTACDAPVAGWSRWWSLMRFELSSLGSE